MSLHDMLQVRTEAQIRSKFGPYIGYQGTAVFDEMAKNIVAEKKELAEKVRVKKEKEAVNQKNIKLAEQYASKGGTLKQSVKISDGKLSVSYNSPSVSDEKSAAELNAMNEQQSAINKYLDPGSEETEVSLLRAGVDPTIVDDIRNIKNVSLASAGIKEQVGAPVENKIRNIVPNGTVFVSGAGSKQRSAPIIKSKNKPTGLISKGFDVEKNIPKDVVNIEGIQEVGAAEAQIKGEAAQLLNWNNEQSQREIKYSILTPKLNFYMELGGRAYKELKDVSKKELGVDIDLSKGGVDYYKNLLIKKGLQTAKFLPLMTALDNLRPELGVELMRQLGPFRSAQQAQKFEETLAQFSGNIKEDIANMSTTIAKNSANIDLIDEEGNTLPNGVRDQRIRAAEATLIRRYNFMYRNMGLIEKPYNAGRSFEWLASNSEFNENEDKLIENAMDDNPDVGRLTIISKLIEQGVL